MEGILKIPREQPHMGSTPAVGAKLSTVIGLLVRCGLWLSSPLRLNFNSTLAVLFDSDLASYLEHEKNLQGSLLNSPRRF